MVNQPSNPIVIFDGFLSYASVYSKMKRELESLTGASVRIVNTKGYDWLPIITFQGWIYLLRKLDQTIQEAVQEAPTKKVVLFAHSAGGVLGRLYLSGNPFPRAKLYQGEQYHGYQASKKRYFYGLKLHLMVTQDGQPVELFLTPGSCFDGTGLYWFDFDLPDGAQVVGDKAYNNYEMEDVLAEAGIHLSPFRKKNSKRPVPPWIRYLQFHYRKMIETTGSLLTDLLPKKIHATSALGFELKLVLFVLAFSFNYLF